MKKEKGFTLIELLGVIIILGAISLIVVPQILSIIEKSNKSTFEESVRSVIRTAENEYTLQGFENWPEEGIDITSSNLDIKQINTFISGTIIKDSNNKVSVSNLTNGKYCANGTKSSLVVEKNTNENCGN